MKRYLLPVMMLLGSFNLFSQELSIKRDSILWDKKVRLRWSDFMGRPDTLSKWTAVCSASIYVKGFRDNDLPNFLVTNSFIKKDAWSKDTVSVRILEHEQLHFDIAEVHARKIRKAVDSLRCKNVKAIEAYSSKIQKLLDMRSETDSLYDEQTNHGVYGNEQLKWKQKILKELEALKNYSLKLRP